MHSNNNAEKHVDILCVISELKPSSEVHFSIHVFRLQSLENAN
jgi:hypothetical protein